MFGYLKRRTARVPSAPYCRLLRLIFRTAATPKCHRAGACVTLTAFERHTVDATRDTDSLDTPRSSDTFGFALR